MTPDSKSPTFDAEGRVAKEAKNFADSKYCQESGDHARVMEAFKVAYHNGYHVALDFCAAREAELRARVEELEKSDKLHLKNSAGKWELITKLRERIEAAEARVEETRAFIDLIEGK